MTLRAVMALVILSVVAACGADGDPIPPEPKEAPVGLSVQGTVSVGIRG